MLQRDMDKPTQPERRRRGKGRRCPSGLALLALVIFGAFALFTFTRRGLASPIPSVAVGVSSASLARLAPVAIPDAAAAPDAAAPSVEATEPESRPSPLGTPPRDAASLEIAPGALATAEVGPGGGVPVHRQGEFRSPFASPGHGRVDVNVGFLLENVEEYDIKKGAFSAHFYVSLTSAKPMPPGISLQATNGKLDTREVLADYPTFKLFKMVGTFNNRPDLHAYPFDTQELVIELEDDSIGTDAMRLVPDLDHTFLDAGFQVAGWDLSFLRARVLSHYYPDRFTNDDLYYSRYKFTLGIKRFATSAVFTVFVPALVIVLISLSGLWYPREELEVRSNATTPMLAAAVLFHFALMQELPATAYLSRADKLMMGTYACLFLHMCSSWIWFVLDEKHTDTVYKWTKRICAPLTLAIMACGVFL